MKLLVAGAVLTIVVSGCGGTPSAASKQQDQQFLDQVDSAAPDASHYRSNTALIRLGRAACDGFSSGVTYEELADRLALSEGPNSLPAEDLGTVITSAVEVFCPKYEDLVN